MKDQEAVKLRLRRNSSTPGEATPRGGDLQSL